MKQKTQKLNRPQTNQLRIIGGEWRGRKLDFPDLPGLRPTTDRVRETLFNWLQAEVYNARCLDLFAGSGALGLESLSRGASSVTFVDDGRKSIDAIKLNIAKLKPDLLSANRAHYLQTDALRFLKDWKEREREDEKKGKSENQFDIIFLDPPFQKNLLPQVISAISDGEMLSERAVIYLEMEKDVSLDLLPENWRVDKEKLAGQVRYMLCRTF